ncbi:MAG: hypothetical protein JWN78_3092 [Bacteroidota bacterium]|nr:hypothetical protein [Bacteroidota bacterium]
MKKKQNIKSASVKVKEVSVLQEPEVQYIAGNTAFPYRIIDTARDGISKGSFMNFINKFDYTLREVASVLNLSERTLQRYENSDKLSKDASERALHFKRLYTKGETVFGSIDAFNEWMKTSNLLFNNKKPMSYLDTSFGFEMLEDELGRIEHGIFA